MIVDFFETLQLLNSYLCHWVVTISLLKPQNCQMFIHDYSKITLTKEFCAQPLTLVWLIVCTKTELEKDIEFRHIKNLSGFKGFTYDYRS